MKILAMSKRDRMEKYIKEPGFFEKNEVTVIPFDADDEAVLKAGSDADIMVVDAISRVSGNVIRRMNRLRMIHSEGVAYNGIDIRTATERGIYVCNCKSMNATAVAEQAVLLMLGLLRGVVSGDAAVREGRQFEVKMAHMSTGDLKEIADCRIGFIGFGDIARVTAKICGVMGAELVYHDIYRASEETEAEYNAHFLPLDELLETSDIVSLHVPVTPETVHMADRDFFRRMKKGAYLINTARGELVAAEDLISAISSGHLAGAGLDTIEGEPVTEDNVMLGCGSDTASKILYSPHIGGITASSFERGYKMICDDIKAIERGEKPGHCVNI